MQATQATNFRAEPTRLPGHHRHLAVPASAAASVALREATHAAHMRLHGHPALTSLLDGTLPRQAYAGLLLRLLGLHAPIEERLRPHDADPLMAWRALADGPPRHVRLQMDLVALGLGSPSVAAAPRAHAVLPALANPAAALGAAWVVEGSALGGAVLARRLEAILGPARQGGAFFSSGPGQAERWRGCRAAVERCGRDPADNAAMAAAAAATFAAFETWLA